jgi:hypothetical protein
MSDNGILSLEPLMDQLRRNKIPYLVLPNTLDWHLACAMGALLASQGPGTIWRKPILLP